MNYTQSDIERVAYRYNITPMVAKSLLESGHLTASRADRLMSNPKLPFILVMLGAVLGTVGTLIFMWQRGQK